MKIPTLQGTIKRRLLVNFRVEPKIIQNILPAEFQPKLYKAKAVVGICLIRLEHIRPKCTPEFIGMTSENAAHRIAVLWENDKGETCEGVYIPRRDTDFAITAALGGSLFPGEHHRASFEIAQKKNEIHFAMESVDKKIVVKFNGKVASALPQTSIFSSLDEASDFFKPGSLGFSVTRDENFLDCIRLETKKWKVDAFEVDYVCSSFYENETLFPKGSIEFDHALIMQNVAHEWHSAPVFELK